MRNVLVIMAALLGLVGCRAGEVARPPFSISVIDAGAKGDGLALATDAIQAAINKYSTAGGGIVRVPAGEYVIGTVQIKSNVTLHLDAGAVLEGSSNPADYRSVDPFTDAVGQVRGHAMIVAVDAKNIAIEGTGAIDGQGARLIAAQKGAKAAVVKPFLVRLVRCSNARVKDVALRNSAAWTFHLSQCSDVEVNSVTINSRGLANNDGIDIDSTQRVKIANCNIDTGDDAICVKATSSAPSRDIGVTGCMLKSNCAGIKLGTESYGDFQNITVDHCQIGRAGLGGIKLFSVDGASLEHVVISNIAMDRVRVPIMIRLGARLKTFRAGDVPRAPGVLRDVAISNVRATNASQIGVLISGVAEHTVESVRLDQIHIELPGGSTDSQEVKLAEKPAAYPEVTMFGNKMPAYGVYARHVRGLHIADFSVVLSAPDLRKAIVTDDVAGAEYSGWNVPGQSATEEAR